MTVVANNLMEGKVVLITGGTSGIGFQTARGLASMGAWVAIVGRDRTKLDAAIARISSYTGSKNLEGFLCDLTSMADVRKLAADFKTRHQRLDVLVNNAGGIIYRRKTTAEGFEQTMALNHLSHFLLTNLLLDLLRSSAQSRIVIVSSITHRFGRIDLEDLMNERHYGPMQAYSNTKLANLIFAFELARRLAGTGVTVNALHPGTVRTNFGKELRGRWKAFILFTKLFSMGAARGAKTSIYLASSPDIASTSGKYFVRRRARIPSKASRDEHLAKRLWDESARLVGTGSP